MANNKQLIDNLIQAICHQSPLLADDAWLPLTARELKYIYESIGHHFVKERIMNKDKPDAAAVALDAVGGSFDG